MILSQIMIAELLYIYHKPVPTAAARVLHQSTLKALLKRKLIQRDGPVIKTTLLGDEVASQKKLNKRKFEADISQSVRALLHVSKILKFHGKRRVA